jgi:hypothetical protein
MVEAKGERNMLWYANQFLGAFAKVRKAPPACSPQRNNPGSTERNFMKFDSLNILRKSAEKIQVPLQQDKNNGYFT